MFGLGPSELAIIAIIVLILFGAKRLPDIGKGLGGAIREFKKVKQDLTAPEEEPHKHADKPLEQVSEASPRALATGPQNRSEDEIPSTGPAREPLAAKRTPKEDRD